MITGNVGKDGAINIGAFQEAILQYRNTPDSTTKLSQAMCVFGRPTKDLIPILPGKYHPHPTWRNSLNLREEALRHRHMRHQEKWSAKNRRGSKTKPAVTQTNGTAPKYANFSPIPHQNRRIRQANRNRKFLRKYIPMYQPAKRRSILEDIAHLPPHHPNYLLTRLLHPPHTPRKDTTSPMTPTRTDMEVNIPPPQMSHPPDFHPSPPPPPPSYKSCSTFTGTHTYREPYPNPTTTEEIHQNQETPYTVTMRKLSLQPPSHTNGLKTWGEIENIEHDYLTHT